MAEVCYIDWHIHPFRADRWLAAWRPAAERALAFGASSCTISRSIDDPLLFRQTSTWRSRDDFERYWFSDEIAAIREEVMNYFNKPLLPSWHSIVMHTGAGAEVSEEAPPAPQEAAEAGADAAAS